MTEPGTSLLGKTVPSPLPFLTSGSTWSVGMKSCTGRSPAGVRCGEETLLQALQWVAQSAVPVRVLWRPEPLQLTLCFPHQLRSAVGKQGAAERPGEVPHSDSAAGGQ